MVSPEWRETARPDLPWPARSCKDVAALHCRAVHLLKLTAWPDNHSVRTWAYSVAVCSRARRSSALVAHSAWRRCLPAGLVASRPQAVYVRRGLLCGSQQILCLLLA